MVQKIYHAPKLIVRCGSWEVEWAASNKWPAPRLPALENIWRMEKFRNCGKNKLADPPSRNGDLILSIYGSRGCSDPKDSVYALRSLVPSLISVVPDYSQNTARVFIAAARAIITDTKPGVLSLSTLERISKKKPST